MTQGKIILCIWIIGALVSGTRATSDVNPVYVDPLDWRLQAEFREYWIESQKCSIQGNYSCSVQELHPVLSLELSNQQEVELRRAMAALYGRLSENSKGTNWQDVILHAERSIEFDDQPHRINRNRENVVLGNTALQAWEECVEALKLLGEPDTSDMKVSVHSAMHAVRCLLNLGRFNEAKLWVEYAQQAIIDGDRIDDLSSWAADISQLQSAMKKLSSTTATLLRPFWWDKREIRIHVLRAIQCDREANHECAILNLEELNDVSLTDRQRAHVNRTLARHYTNLALQSIQVEMTDATFSDLRKAIALQDNPRRQAQAQGLLLYLLTLKQDWNACTVEGVALFEGEEFVATENSHIDAMRLGYCFWRVGDQQNSREWVAQARRLAQYQGTFIGESWGWFLNELSTTE